jgi:hypothetical protein
MGASCRPRVYFHFFILLFASVQTLDQKQYFHFQDRESLKYPFFFIFFIHFQGRDSLKYPADLFSLFVRLFSFPSANPHTLFSASL